MYFCFNAAGNDFTPTTIPLTFGPSTLSVCTNIEILQDGVLETTENFLVQLNTEDQSVLLSPSTVNVTIVDMNGEF